MSSIFSKIIEGEIPSYKIAESDEFLAFFDINPVAIGHTLVIPKKEVDYIFDVEDDELGRMMIFSKKVAEGIKAVIPCSRIGVTIIGLEVPHAHIHLIPINSLNDMNFEKPKQSLQKEEFTRLAKQIRSKIIEI